MPRLSRVPSILGLRFLAKLGSTYLPLSSIRLMCFYITATQGKQSGTVSPAEKSGGGSNNITWCCRTKSWAIISSAFLAPHTPPSAP